MSERRYIHEFPNGKFRDCTPEEVAEALAVAELDARLVAERDAAMQRYKEFREGVVGACTHPVCYDEPGHVYDLRHCVRCMNVSLI